MEAPGLEFTSIGHREVGTSSDPLDGPGAGAREVPSLPGQRSFPVQLRGLTVEIQPNNQDAKPGQLYKRVCFLPAIWAQRMANLLSRPGVQESKNPPQQPPEQQP